MVQSADRQKHGQHERELIDPGAINDRFNWRKTEKKKDTLAHGYTRSTCEDSTHTTHSSSSGGHTLVGLKIGICEIGGSYITNQRVEYEILR
jgi:hypothetical protein